MLKMFSLLFASRIESMEHSRPKSICVICVPKQLSKKQHQL